jgi:GT2 family glycosyltransferase
VVEPLVCAVVLNWNGGQRVADCVRSVLQCAYGNLRVIVVDNASTDDSAACLREEFPRAELILNEVNAGFAGGSNLGIRRALAEGAEFVLLLNNDLILDKSLVSELVAAAAGHDAGLAVPKIFYQASPRRIWSAGAVQRRFPPRITMIGLRQEDGPRYSVERTVDCAVGCAVLVRAGVFQGAGLLDECYFMYFEDYDFSLRARNAGYKIVFAPKAMAWHAVAASTGDNSGRMWSLWARSLPRFYLKNYRWPVASLASVAAWIAIREVLKGNGRFLGPYLAGLRAGWREYHRPPGRAGTESAEGAR